jgi:hypothetical protein
VCADFALITTALLRQAGILSGVAIGFLPDGKKVTTQHAHGCSFALFPTQTKDTQILLIDGTPHSNEVQSLPPLTTRQQQQEQQQQAVEQTTLQQLSDINDLMDKHSDFAALKEHLATLYNGNLEDTMNAILRYRIQPTQYHRVVNLLNAYRYSPLKSTQNAETLHNFMAKELDRPPLSSILPNEAGSQLFEAVQSFVQRFSKQNTLSNAFQKLDFLITTAQDLLTPDEYLAVLIIAKYLKAEKMFR